MTVNRSLNVRSILFPQKDLTLCKKRLLARKLILSQVIQGSPCTSVPLPTTPPLCSIISQLALFQSTCNFGSTSLQNFRIQLLYLNFAHPLFCSHATRNLFFHVPINGQVFLYFFAFDNLSSNYVYSFTHP